MESTITFITSDGKRISSIPKIYERCKTIKNLTEDLEGVDEIPLPNVGSKELSLIFEYCEKFEEQTEVKELSTELKSFMDKHGIWEKTGTSDFFIYNIILACNYLELEDLLNIGCLIIANKLKGKSVDEMRTFLNITNDLTPEEEEAIKKENAWCDVRD